jgi:SAM-dependent methyltransferase
MKLQREYWDNRFKKEGKIWGDTPSKSALIALEYFKSRDIKTILVPGAGYGRNTKIFSDQNYSVEGIEISETAFNIAKQFDPQTMFHLGSALDMPFTKKNFDAIYCFNTLHLFLSDERSVLIKKCFKKLRKKGFIFFIVFSIEDESYGKGKEIEEYTFESKPNRPVHYFTEDDLIEHFNKFFIINIGKIVDKENHGEKGPHHHKLIYIFAQKK